MKKKLYRSRDDRMLTGLAGGIAEYFKIDSTLVRIGFILLEFLTAGMLIIGYVIISFVVPVEPTGKNGRKKVKNQA